ncbi:MAG: ribosome-binding factor A [Myxococcales bacterium]|nr:ribosome-binding factor A [Myxococcales bacterium]MCB9578291.1 ribosome-binding factor A [Polyangiaceae bacterium]MCB9583720.1 ribosome-binding factor A [Polyangiaceae bacterium]
MRTRIRNASRNDRKLAQLCAQIQEVLSFALGDSSDDRLHDLVVHSVTPAPDGARLLVTVMATNESDMSSLEETHGALESARPWLRRQVAAEISRKRTPDLAFCVLPHWDGEP